MPQRLRFAVLLCLAWIAPTLTASQMASPGDHQPTAPATLVRTGITVVVPHDEATIAVDGAIVEGAGPRRRIETPPAPRGSTGRLTIEVRWQANAYTAMTRTSTVMFRAGQAMTVDLREERPTDRVFVDYVPTSQHVVDAMVALAGVTPEDVVYEPGCGDARITIAAVRAGARAGVGIDIDPERVEESRANVRAAGLDDRIDIRLGDALDIPDLSKATVVLMYMGEHFNARMRPLLWKALPVGARIVSYRFTMGDWAPDRTVQVGGRPGWEFQLHLWTITEAVKRRGGEARWE